MIEFAPSAPLDRQPISLLWAWHQRVYKEACDAFKAGNFSLMHRCYARLAEIKKEIEARDD